MSESGWRWDAVSMVLPQDVVLGIQATAVAIATRNRDKLMWVGTPNGCSAHIVPMH